MALNPAGLDAAIAAQGHLHTMAAIDHLETSIGGVHAIHCRKDGQVFDVFDMSVSIGVNMRIKSTCDIDERNR